MVGSLSGNFVRYLFGTFVWNFGLGLLFELLFWNFCLGLLFGTFVWDFCLELLCWNFGLELLFWNFCLELWFGTFVWELCLGTLFGKFVLELWFGKLVWDFCWGTFQDLGEPGRTFFCWGNQAVVAGGTGGSGPRCPTLKILSKNPSR